MLWNSQFQRVDVNPAYERMYGYSRDEVLGGARARDLPTEYRRQQEEIVARTLAGERCHEEIMETIGGPAGGFRSKCAPSRSSIGASRTCSR